MEDEKPSGAPTWVVTFADLMSLLLTFFVLLLSFSTTEVVKFRAAMESIQDALGVHSPDDPSNVPTGPSAPAEDAKMGGSPTSVELEQELRKVLERFQLQQRGETQTTPYGVVLLLDGDLVFHSGEAVLTPQIYPLLDGLAKSIVEVKRRVDVIGHTDNLPISTSIYPSNWELSAARAGVAVRYLVSQGVPPGWLRAIGQADAIPIDTNDTPEGRARNRRIEFVFSEKPLSDLPTATTEQLKANATVGQPLPPAPPPASK